MLACFIYFLWGGSFHAGSYHLGSFHLSSLCLSVSVVFQTIFPSSSFASHVPPFPMKLVEFLILAGSLLCLFSSHRCSIILCCCFLVVPLDQHPISMVISYHVINRINYLYFCVLFQVITAINWRQTTCLIRSFGTSSFNSMGIHRPTSSTLSVGRGLRFHH